MNSQKILLTGATSPIAFETVQMLVDRGCAVSLVCKSNDSKLRCAAIYHRIVSEDQIHVIDLRQLDKVHASGVRFATHGFDAIVNIAGVWTPSEIPYTATSDEVSNLWNVNFVSPVVLSEMLMAPMMERGWGRVVTVSSVGVKYGGSVAGRFYTASKAALESVTRSWAKLVTSRGVTANVVRVGVTDTGMHSRIPGKDMKQRIQQIPAQRMASPDEVARVITFLLSEEASFVSGATWDVTGGE